MTNITSTARTKSYTGNGTPGPFDFSFQVNSFTEVKVFVDDTLKTAGAHYNVENSNNESSKLNADGTGRIRFTSGNFPTSGQRITIVSDVPLSRTSVYTTGGPITASSLETDFDTSLMHHQQISTKINRTITAPESDVDTISMTLPSAPFRANSFVKFDANGNVTTSLISDLTSTTFTSTATPSTTASPSIILKRDVLPSNSSVPPFLKTVIGEVKWQARNDANELLDWARIVATLRDEDDTEESVMLSFEGLKFGSFESLLAINPISTTYGADFRFGGRRLVFEGSGSGEMDIIVPDVSNTDRVIIFPNLTGTVALTSGTQTFSNKTLTNPRIAHIDSAGSDITLDAQNDIKLNADNGNIFFQDDTTTFGSVTNSSGNLIIKSGTTTALSFDSANVTADGNFTVTGDLTVNGNTVTVNTSTLAVEDPLIILAKSNSSSDSVDIGFYGKYGPMLDRYAGLFRDASDGKFRLFRHLQEEPTTTVNTSGAGYLVGTLVADIEGDLTGTASKANQVNMIVQNNSNDETVYPTFVDGRTGNQYLETDNGLFYNPSTGVLTTTQVNGDLSGNATTATSATTATTATNANHVLVADNENTDENNLIPFIEDGSATGNVGLESDGDLTYNPSTGRLSATQLAGTLQTASQTNVTGVGVITTGVWNATAIADAYISSSATWNAKVDTGGTGLTKVGTTLNVDSSQPGITSLGTLTSLTVDNITINGSEIDFSSNGLIDTGGDLLIDVGTPGGGGAKITFGLGGSDKGHIDLTNSDLTIKSLFSDRDIIFKGNDNGYEITALTLDMSEGGEAIFNGGIISLKNSGSQSELRLYCESNNAHYASLKAPAHADFSGNITLTLPATTGTLLSTANSDAPTTTTSSSDADFVLVDDGGVMKKITPANLGIGSGTSGITVQDEGSSLSTAGTTLNFVGAGVTASGTGAVKTITISGGGSGSGGAFTDQTWGASLDSDSSTKSKLHFKNDYRNIVIGTSNTVAEPSASLDQTGNAYDNIFIGYNSGNGATTAIRNVLVGRETGHTLTSGDDNTFIGYQAGYQVNSDHDRSVIVGMSAGSYMPNGGNESTVAVGYSAGVRARNHAVAIGAYAGTNFGYYGSGNGAYQCVHIGGYAGYNYYNYYRDYNVTVGYGSGQTARSGDHNVMEGINADGLTSNTSYAVAVGSNAKVASNSVSIGYQSQNSGNSASFGLVTIGYQAGYDMDGGDDSIFIGYRAGYAGGTANNNIGIGKETLYDLNSGNDNVAIGYRSLYELGIGHSNIAIGYQSGLNVTGADRCIYIGYEAGKSNTGGNASSDHNIGIGYRSLYEITSGLRNTSIGGASLQNLTDGDNNVAIGYQAGDTITSGSYNVCVGMASDVRSATMERGVAVGYHADITIQGTAVGYLSQSSAHSGTFGATTIGYNAGNQVRNDYNTYVGFEAGKGSAGDENVGIGKSAIDAMSSSADNNTAVGANSMNIDGGSVSGSSNSALGHSAGSRLDSGSDNTAVGANAMGGATNLTGSNNTCIGHDAIPSSASVSNEITLGDSNVATLRCQVTSITALSDQRDKTAIEDLDLGLKFVNAMKPRKFTWNRRDGKWVGKKEIGFIAQELHELEMDFSSTERTRLVNYENPSRLEAQPMNTYPILVKAIQELSAKVDSLQAEVTKLKGE